MYATGFSEGGEELSRFIDTVEFHRTATHFRRNHLLCSQMPSNNEESKFIIKDGKLPPHGPTML